MSTFPAILLQAQYFNLLDYLTRHFEIRGITKDPAARRQAEDRVRTAFAEVSVSLTDFAEDDTQPSTLLNRQREAQRLVQAIREVTHEPYSRELFTLACQAFGAFLTQPVHQELAA